MNSLTKRNKFYFMIYDSYFYFCILFFLFLDDCNEMAILSNTTVSFVLQSQSKIIYFRIFL